MKKHYEKKNKLQSKNILLILGVVYTLISILAIISYVSKMSNISTTPVTLSSVLGSIWWQLLMIVLFAASYFLYNKKIVLGVLLEIIMGMAMLVYIVISIATIGMNLFALIVELIYPLLLIFHGLITFKSLTKKNKIKKSTI